MKAKKRYGQNFLIDNNIIEQIVQSFSAEKEDLIIEIGPGCGALTKKLMEFKSFIMAYEIDTDMKSYLSSLESDKVVIKYQDFLESNIKEDIKTIKYNNLYIVGNLPYYITTPIIEHIIQSKINFKSLTIMVQKEVADRFRANPKTKDYGFFTLFLKYYFDIKKVCNVSKNCFNPVPKIDSAVIQLTPHNRYNLDEEAYFRFLKNCFAQKRKTLKNNLGIEAFNKLSEVLKKYNLTESVRAEELTEEQFIELFRTYNN